MLGWEVHSGSFPLRMQGSGIREHRVVHGSRALGFRDSNFWAIRSLNWMTDSLLPFRPTIGPPRRAVWLTFLDGWGEEKPMYTISIQNMSS